MTVSNDLLDLAPGVSQRFETVRYDLINLAGQVIGQLHPEQGRASIQVNTEATVIRTLSGLVVSADEYADVNPYKDRVAPKWVLSDNTEWPLGVFHFTGDPVQEERVRLTTLQDPGYLLDQGCTVSAFGVAQGGSIENAMRRVVSRARIRDFVLEETNARAREPIAWPPGTRWIEILDKLCTLAGYYPPHFNNTGTLRLRAAVEPATAPVDISHSDEGRIVAGSRVTNANLLDAPNAHIVISSGASETEVTGVAYVDPTLPWSKENRNGLVIAEVHREQGIETTAQARRMAKRYASTSAADAQEITFSTAPDPRHDVFTIVQYGAQRFLEVGWSLRLQPGGEHTHRILAGGFEIDG